MELPGALVEVYDVSADAPAQMYNISTRAEVGHADDVMIGGFVIGYGEPAEVLVRAIGPSLQRFGFVGALADPMLEIHDQSGTLIAANDDWKSDRKAALEQTGISPSNDAEAAVLLQLSGGFYTAIVRGKEDSTGVALVEVYRTD